MNQEILDRMPEWYRMLMKAIQEHHEGKEDGADPRMVYQADERQVAEEKEAGGVTR